jgi:hypothetical protein
VLLTAAQLGTQLRDPPSFLSKLTKLTARPHSSGCSFEKCSLLPCCLQNWGKEVTKWLGDRLDTVVVDDTKADKVKKFLQVQP